jgi:hypothetical protein
MSNNLKALFVVKPHGLITTEAGDLVNYVLTIYERSLATNFQVYYISTSMYFPSSGEEERDERVFLKEQKYELSKYLARLRSILGPHPLDVLDLRKAAITEDDYSDIVQSWNDSC